MTELDILILLFVGVVVAVGVSKAWAEEKDQEAIFDRDMAARARKYKELESK